MYNFEISNILNQKNEKATLELPAGHEDYAQLACSQVSERVGVALIPMIDTSCHTLEIFSGRVYTRVSV